MQRKRVNYGTSENRTNFGFNLLKIQLCNLLGLLIGEMILAVNKDLLIDCNYDTAATLLKRAEGIVTLTVCNPNKKADGTDDITAVVKEEQKPKKGKIKPKIN